MRTQQLVMLAQQVVALQAGTVAGTMVGLKQSVACVQRMVLLEMQHRRKPVIHEHSNGIGCERCLAPDSPPAVPPPVVKVTGTAGLGESYASRAQMGVHEGLDSVTARARPSLAERGRGLRSERHTSLSSPY